MSIRPRDDLIVQLLILGLATGVIVASFLLDTTSSEVSFFGWPVPQLCTFKRVTGWDCPGCGLTRSFVFTAHFQLWDALKVNWFGPAGWVFVFAQIPLRSLRAARLLRGMSAARKGS